MVAELYSPASVCKRQSQASLYNTPKQGFNTYSINNGCSFIHSVIYSNSIIFKIILLNTSVTHGSSEQRYKKGINYGHTDRKYSSD